MSLFSLSLSSADAKYYTKTMAAPNPKVWTDFLAVVMKVWYTCTLYIYMYIGGVPDRLHVCVFHADES